MPDLARIAIVGRPNVGKSSLVNSLLGEERNIVTPVAGTTRDSIYTRFNKFQHDFLLVDTAGLRKKGKVSEDIEFYSVMRAVKTIENSDICLLLIDATRGIEAQDLNIMSLIQKNNKGMIVLVNKWDLIEKDSNTTKRLEQEIRSKTAPFTDYDILFISAINKQRIHNILELIEKVIIYKFPKKSNKELEEMFGLSEWKQTQFYKDVKLEGIKEGKLEGIKEGKLETIPLLVKLGLSLEQIAKELDIDLEIVKQEISKY